jgi:hypothetical protein
MTPGSAVRATCHVIGVAVSTPLGFAALADSALPGRVGQTMRTGEVGRELGDVGGPLIVGAGTVISLDAGFGALAVAMVLAADASLSLHQAVESGDLPSNDSDIDSDHMESDDA